MRQSRQTAEFTGTTGVGSKFWKNRRSRRYAMLCLVFFLSFFVFLSGGRLASGDAGAQLQSAILLANTGSLSASAPRRRLRGCGCKTSKATTMSRTTLATCF